MPRPPAILILILAIVAMVPAGATSEWMLVTRRSVAGVALFDIDRDGEIEIVGSNFIYDHGMLVDIDEAVVFKAPFDDDSLLDLVVYYPSSGTLYVYGTRQSRTFSVERNARTYSSYSSGFRVGRTLFGAGRSVVAGEGDVPAVVGGSVCYTRFADGTLLLVCPHGQTEVYKMPGDYRVVDAYAAGDKLAVILSSPSRSVYIEYDIPSGVPYVSPFPVPLTRCVYASPEFVCSDGYRLYSVSSKLNPLPVYASSLLPVESVGRFAVAQGDTVSVYEYSGGVLRPLVSARGLPDAPLAMDALQQRIVVATQAGVLLYAPTKIPRVDVQAPPSTVVGERVEVIVSGVYDQVEVSLGPYSWTLRESPARVATELQSVGVATVIAKGCVEGGLCVTVVRNITVLARRMNLEMVVPRSVEPYGTLTVTLKVYDALTNSEVRTAYCIVTLGAGGETYTVQPFVEAPLPARPHGNEVVVSAVCSAPNYVPARGSAKVALARPFLDASLTYLGGGKFRVEAFNTYTGELFDGVVKVTVGGNATTFMRGGEFVVPRGLHTVLVELIRGNEVLLRKEFTVSYFGTVYDVPQGEVIKVADRPVVTTVTQTSTVTTTRTELRINTVERVDVPLSIGLIVLGLGVGLSLSYILVKERVRRDAG